MKKTTEEKIEKVLVDDRMSTDQREMLDKWYRHTRQFADENSILERAYTIREFAIFINKPFHLAVCEDMNAYLRFKLDQKTESLTKNRILPVTGRSVSAYKLRLTGFYRYLLKHSNNEIDNDLAYPTPEIINRVTIPREQRHKLRVEALLSNSILTQLRADRGLSPEQIRIKYADKLLKEQNLKTLRDYYNYKITSGLVSSHVGFTSKLSYLKRFGLFLGDRSYKEATREDIQNYLAVVQSSNGTINTSYKAHLLDFYRFVYGMFGNEQPRNYPEVVSWLYTRRKKIDDRLAKAIIPDGEIKLLIDACDNSRDKALIAVLRDCSCRIGELMNCRIRDVNITEKTMADSKYKHQIATIRLRGKTGERLNLLHWSVSYIRQWIQVHPLRTKPDFYEAPLFVARKESRYGQPLTPVGVNDMIQRMAALAGIKRHIHAHLFRHTNLTHMAKVLSETELKIHAGWGSNSKMASVYVHLSYEDVHNKLLKSMGFNVEDGAMAEENMLKTQICPNHICAYENIGDAKFCVKCGYPLSMETAVQMKRIKEQEEEIQRDIMSKDLSSVNVGKDTDLKEVMYQILKSDPKLVDKLKDIISNL